MQPPAEHVHWLFATGPSSSGCCCSRRRSSAARSGGSGSGAPTSGRALLFGLGVFMWPVMVFFTNSTIHMLAHSVWAQVMMLAGAAELGLVSGKLKSEWWRLCVPLAFAVSGAAFLIHEANPWLYSRSAFVHHACGWILIVGALFPLGGRVQAALAHDGGTPGNAGDTAFVWGALDDENLAGMEALCASMDTDFYGAWPFAVVAGNVKVRPAS